MSSLVSPPLSGLPLKIHSSTESETFDFANTPLHSIQSTIASAFANPFTHLSSTIRLTFVIGGGKLVRGKYDDNTFKTVSQALKSVGYLQDTEGGDESIGGCWKSQHDTGKNLKTVVVFPRITEEVSVGGDGGGKGGGEGGEGENPLLDLPSSSPLSLLLQSSAQVYTSMLSSKLPTYSAKKSALIALEALGALHQSLETKLFGGQILSEKEQIYYDSVEGLANKVRMLQDNIKKQVDKGDLTASEKKLLIDNVEERITALGVEIIDSSSQPKKVEKLNDMLAKALERKKMLQKARTGGAFEVRLKGEDGIKKLRSELGKLLVFELSFKGRLPSLSESEKLSRIPEIHDEIASLEDGSRNWFEEDDEFKPRCDALLKEHAKLLKPKPAAAAVAKKGTGISVGSVGKSMSAPAGGGYKVSGAGAGWSTVGKAKQPLKSSSGGGGGVRGATGAFAAMMDSDSD